MKSTIALILAWIFFFSGKQAPQSFSGWQDTFIKDYAALQIPEFTLDYKEYFRTIPSPEALAQQKVFFDTKKKELESFTKVKLSYTDGLKLKQIRYEISFNEERIALEQGWVKAGRKIPARGLHELSNNSAWYRYFVKKFTSLDLGPEEIMEYGKSEVKRVQSEIQKIRDQQEFSDSASFYSYLQKDDFFIKDKNILLKEFGRIDSAVRLHLPAFIGTATIPPVYAMEWPDAGANTPPGIYLNHENNAYGKDVFQYNFYEGRYNKRAMEWLYMHEAIPGHHLQFTFGLLPGVASGLDSIFIYPGNFEGWGCYVEYFGKELGLYTDSYSYLGKWEWDLVRSARLVLDAGIHYYGWSHDEALQYWKSVIPGQDGIAEREITRVTNWPSQALSYKTGAHFIFQLKDEWQKTNPHRPVSEFHRAYLECGRLPLPVVREGILAKR